MPDIEIRGYEPGNAATMKQKVRAALAAWPEPEEIVTSIVPCEVEDLQGKKMPFLRVIASPDELPHLKVLLAPLNEDIEVIPLGEWIPKQKVAVIPAAPSEEFLAAKKRLEVYTVRGHLRPEKRIGGYSVYDEWRDSMLQQWEHHLIAEGLTEDEARQLCR